MQKTEEAARGRGTKAVWQPVERDEAKSLPGYGFGIASLSVCAVAIVEILVDVVFINILSDDFYGSAGNLPFGSERSSASWVALFFGLLHRFPPAFIAEALILFHIFLSATLVLSTFQFNAGLYKKLWLLVWITPAIRMAMLASEALSAFPHFWNAHLLGSRLPAPAVLPVLLSFVPKKIVVVAVEFLLLFTLWRLVLIAKSPNLTYLLRRRVAK